LRHLRGPLLLLAIYIGFFWKLTLSGQYTWLDSPDMTYMIAPWVQMQTQAVHHAVFPLWDPFDWGGMPLLAQMQPGTACPLNWLLFLMPMVDGKVSFETLNWYFVLLHYLGGLFCYWLCRDLGRGFGAAILAGAAFGLGGFLGNTDWPQHLNSALWLPLVFLFFLRLYSPESRVRDAAFAGTFLGLAWLGGHPQIPLTASIALAFCWLFVARRRVVAKLASFAVFAACVGALQVLPAMEFGKLIVRWVGLQDPIPWDRVVPYSIHAGLSFKPAALLGLTIPGFVAATVPFMGWVVLALALLGVAWAWGDIRIKVLTGVGLGGLIVSFGANSVFHGVLYSIVPAFEKARDVSFAIFLFHFALAVVAAFGVDALAAGLPVWRGRMIRVLLVSAAVLAFVSLVVSAIPKSGEPTGLMTSAFAAALLAAILYGQLTHRTAVTLMVLLSLFEIGQVTGMPYQPLSRPESLLRKLFAHDDIAAFLKAQPGAVRVEIDDGPIPYNFGDWYSIDAFDASVTGLPSVLARVQGNGWCRMIFGVNFYAGAKPRRDGQQDVFTSRSGVKVYRNPDALPRVWTVHEASTIARPEDADRKLTELGPRLREQAFFLGATPELKPCSGGDSAVLLSRGLGNLAIEADMQCAGLVIAGEAYFPGWRAKVDGRSQPIWAADTVLRGVVVPAGRHHIEMVYRPWRFVVGGLLTLLGLAASITLGLRR
jgi:hypothetical protein